MYVKLQTSTLPSSLQPVGHVHFFQQLEIETLKDHFMLPAPVAQSPVKSQGLGLGDELNWFKHERKISSHQDIDHFHQFILDSQVLVYGTGRSTHHHEYLMFLKIKLLKIFKN